MYSARPSCAGSSRMRTLLSMLKPECFQDRRFRAKSSPEELRHRLKPGERDIEEDTLQNDGMEVRVPPEHVSEGLVGDNHAGEKCSTHRFVVELLQDTVNQSGYFGEQDRSLSTTGGTQVEALAGERAKVVMTAFGVGTADPRDTLEIVAARRKPLSDLPDTLKAIPTVGGGVLLLVVLAEVGEVAVEDGMELIAATGSLPFHRNHFA